MRDYLYLWNDPIKKRLVASGIEFRDLLSNFETTGGIVLLKHRFDAPQFDPGSRFDFVPADCLNQIAEDDVYGYGDFCWADFPPDTSLADLTDEAIAELTFFAHAARPLHEVSIAGLGNRFLCWAHDDGWFARIYYSDWGSVDPILRRLIASLLKTEETSRVLDCLRQGESAYWCRAGAAIKCEKSEDISALQRTYRTSS